MLTPSSALGIWLRCWDRINDQVINPDRVGLLPTRLKAFGEQAGTISRTRFLDYVPPAFSLPKNLAARAGIEPCIRILDACAQVISSEIAKTTDAQLRAQEFSNFVKMIYAWGKLSRELRTAMLPMAGSVVG